MEWELIVLILGWMHVPLELCFFVDGLIFDPMVLMRADIEEAVDWCL